jgi:hypothetical protein
VPALVKTKDGTTLEVILFAVIKTVQQYEELTIDYSSKWLAKRNIQNTSSSN